MFNRLRRTYRVLTNNDKELWAAQINAEECGEILAEFKVALSGLAGERLAPCCHECCGHLGPRGNDLFNDGIEAYNALDPLPPPPPPNRIVRTPRWLPPAPSVTPR